VNPMLAVCAYERPIALPIFEAGDPHDREVSGDSFFLRGLRARGFPAVPALPPSLLALREHRDAAIFGRESMMDSALVTAPSEFQCAGCN
jgi:hypothetical protein